MPKKLYCKEISPWMKVLFLNFKKSAQEKDWIFLKRLRLEIILDTSTRMLPRDYLSSFKNNSNSQLTITGSGEVKIFVTGDMDLSAISDTTIAPSKSGQPGPKATMVVGKDAKFQNYGEVNIGKGSDLNVFAEKFVGNGSKAVNIDCDAKMMISAGELDFSGGAFLNVKQWTKDAWMPANLRLFASKSASFGAGAHVSSPLFICGFFLWKQITSSVQTHRFARFLFE